MLISYLGVHGNAWLTPGQGFLAIYSTQVPFPQETPRFMLQFRSAETVPDTFSSPHLFLQRNLDLVAKNLMVAQIIAADLNALRRRTT